MTLNPELEIMDSGVPREVCKDTVTSPGKHQVQCPCPAPFERAADVKRSVSGLHESLGFPKLRGTFLGAPIIKTTVYWGLYWGPLILGNYRLVVARGGYILAHEEHMASQDSEF